MSSNKSHKFIISGGGTGGHIYPAIAIADEIKRRTPDAEILFVGAKGKMEMGKVPQAGYPIEGLTISGLSRTLSPALLIFPFKFIKSLVQAREIIGRFRPHMVIGTGGYASGSILLSAVFRKIPTLLQEQNAYPGITNKRLAKYASAVCVAYEGLDKIFRSNNVKLTGNPVRVEMFEKLPSKAEAMRFFGLNPQQKVIFSVGGSLGSRNMNNAWKAKIEAIKAHQEVQLLWQTGSADFKTLKEDDGLKADNIHLHEFIYQMQMAYAAADVIVSRAGAIAVSELCLVGKAVVLIPLPWAAEDHQTKNAQTLVDKHAALMIKDQEADDLLVPTVLDLLQDDAQCASLAANISKQAKPCATSDIVDEIFRVLK